jgi:hypothetical protein
VVNCALGPSHAFINNLCELTKKHAQKKNSTFRVGPPYIGKRYAHGVVMGIHELKLQLLLPVAHVRVKQCSEGRSLFFFSHVFFSYIYIYIYIARASQASVLKGESCFCCLFMCSYTSVICLCVHIFICYLFVCSYICLFIFYSFIHNVEF